MFGNHAVSTFFEEIGSIWYCNFVTGQGARNFCKIPRVSICLERLQEFLQYRQCSMILILAGTCFFAVL